MELKIRTLPTIAASDFQDAICVLTEVNCSRCLGTTDNTVQASFKYGRIWAIHPNIVVLQCRSGRIATNLLVLGTDSNTWHLGNRVSPTKVVTRNVTKMEQINRLPSLSLG